MMLFIKNLRKEYCVIVADCGGCDCHAFVLKLLESAGINIKTGSTFYMIIRKFSCFLVPGKFWQSYKQV